MTMVNTCDMVKICMLKEGPAVTLESISLCSCNIGEDENPHGIHQSVETHERDETDYSDFDTCRIAEVSYLVCNVLLSWL